jgi:hypothetical protein
MNDLLAVAVAVSLQLIPVGDASERVRNRDRRKLNEKQRATLHLALMGVVQDATPIEISPFRYVGGIPNHARATFESSAAAGPMRILWIVDCTYDPAEGQWGCDTPAEIRTGTIDGVHETIEVDGEFPAPTLLEIIRWLRQPPHNLAPAAEVSRLKLTGNPLGRHWVTAQYRDAQGVVHTDHLINLLNTRDTHCYGGFRLSRPIARWF